MSKKESVTVASVACCLSAFAMLLTSFIYAVITKKQAYILRDGFTNMVTNWNNDMVFDLSLQSSPVLPDENYYTTEWNSIWPGNIDGCYCWKSNSKKKVTVGLKTSSCNANQTSMGCKDISGTSPQTMNKWKGSQTIYAIRAKSTSFYANYRNMNSDGTCAKGFRICGDKNSKSKGLCIPEKYTKCPISHIQNSNPGGYTSLALNSLTLYYSNSNQYNSVCDLVYSQAFTCFIRTHYSKSPGRTPYGLLKGDYTSCIEDPTVIDVDEIGETDLLTLNGINHSKLYSFDTSNNWKWKLSAGRFIDWSPDCKDTVMSLSDKTVELNTMADQYLTMFILYIISFVLATISHVARFITCLQNQSKPYKWCVFLRIATFILIAPSLIICTAKASQFLSFFKSISDLGCSNDDVNKIFEYMAEDIRLKVVSKTILFTVLAFAGLGCDIFSVCIDLNCEIVYSSKSDVGPSVYSPPAPDAPQPVDNVSMGFNGLEKNAYAKPHMEEESDHKMMAGLSVTGQVGPQSQIQTIEPSFRGQQYPEGVLFKSPAKPALMEPFQAIQAQQPSYGKTDSSPVMMTATMPLIGVNVQPISSKFENPPVDREMNQFEEK
jgi:hypothetical protein